MRVRDLEPSPLWNHFADLNAVPRASKREQRVIEFMKRFGQQLALETIVDSIGNVIIRKPASPGMEDRVPIVMQSHLDMVHQKNANVEFDFATQGINMIVDGDWVKADGTTLGADNGVGAAAIMSVLASSEIVHPAIEGLFTIDEETGMTGAQGLAGGLLQGKILLNLDTEDDNELTIGCAGGVDVTANVTFRAEKPRDASMTGYRIAVRGLKGGHSGVDIHLGRGNANKLMNRILWTAQRAINEKLRLAELDGGGLRNAIPRESVAIVAVPNDAVEQFETAVASCTQEIYAEYALTDPDTDINLAPHACPSDVMPARLQTVLLAALYACPNGIYRMSPSIPELVQTSNNLARVIVKNDCVAIQCLTRSSVNTERDDLANAICACFGLLGGMVEQAGAYSGWQPAPESSIVKLMSAVYERLFHETPHVAACHAGLECGILGRNYPQIEMISFGPNITGAHSPDEQVQISSVKKFWRFLLETLREV